MLNASKKFSKLNALFEVAFASQATSAPMECVFSISGQLMRRYHVQMTYQLSSRLVYLNCNKQ